MTIELVTSAATSLRDQFAEEGNDATSVNMGLCADFADALAGHLAAFGVEVGIFSLDDFWSENGGVDDVALARRKWVVLPSGLDWDTLARVDFANQASHTWVEFGQVCFDAEVPAGMTNPFDLPSVRHALTEILDNAPEAFPDGLEDSPWWLASRAIRSKREAGTREFVSTIPCPRY